MSLLTSLFVIFFLLSYGNPRGLHSFPTRRSSDLRLMAGAHRTNEVSIEANGLQFQYQEWGDARSRHAVVLLHGLDRKSTRLNSSHLVISYAVFCLKKKK